MGQPLKDLLVVDLGTMVAIPYAGQTLGELGARVVKVEGPDGDPLRKDPPVYRGMSAHFWNVNRGKQSVVVDLKTKEGAAFLDSLADSADVIMENWRPGVAHRLGLDLERLRTNHPKLITVSVRGFGNQGPYAKDRAYDPIIQALSSMAWSQGDDQKPSLVKTTICDKITSLAVVQGVLAALVERSQTGHGQHVQVNMLDAAVSFLWPDMMRADTFVDVADVAAETVPESRGALLAQGSDRKWLVCTALTDEQWRALCLAVQHPDWEDLYAGQEIRRRYREWLSDNLLSEVPDWTRDEVIGVLHNVDVPCAAVLTAREMFSDPQVRSNETVAIVEREGLGSVREVTPIVRLGSPQGWTPSALGAPGLGEHTSELIREFASKAAQIIQPQ